MVIHDGPSRKIGQVAMQAALDWALISAASKLIVEISKAMNSDFMLTCSAEKMSKAQMTLST